MDENNKPYDGEIPFVPDEVKKADTAAKSGEPEKDTTKDILMGTDEATKLDENFNEVTDFEAFCQAASDPLVDVISESEGEETTGHDGATPPPVQNVWQAPPPQQNGWQAPPPQQNGWQAPPPQQNGWQAAPPQQNGWQAPPPQQNGWQAPPPQQNGWQAAPQAGQPPQQTQWSFHDYGPVQPKGVGEPPKPKKEKKSNEKTGNKGFKVLAIVMSALFVLSVAGFSSFLIFDIPKNSDSTDKTTGSVSSEQAGAPSMDISNTPQASQGDQNGDGTLSGKEIYAKVSPSVVGIAVYTRGMGQVLQSQGSGIMLTKDGYLVTNCHVVSETSLGQEVVKIEIIMPNGDTYEAKTIGEDAKTDLAVLKINGSDFTIAEFGDSSKLNIGDRVYVIGNPSGIKFSGSMTQGVVSSLSRSLYISELDTEIEYIQTDAAINSGNSGGAFINEYGQVVGISAAKMRTEAGYEGMGFAIPIDNAKDVVNSLIKNGYVANRPMIGIQYVAVSSTLAELNGIPRGLRVHTVQADSDAFKKGIKAGDIITKMDGQEVYDTATTASALKNKKPGDTLVLTVFKVDEQGKGATVEVPVILMEQKPAVVSSAPLE